MKREQTVDAVTELLDLIRIVAIGRRGGVRDTNIRREPERGPFTVNKLGLVAERVLDVCAQRREEHIISARFVEDLAVAAIEGVIVTAQAIVIAGPDRLDLYDARSARDPLLERREARARLLARVISDRRAPARRCRKEDHVTARRALCTGVDVAPPTVAQIGPERARARRRAHATILTNTVGAVATTIVVSS